MPPCRTLRNCSLLANTPLPHLAHLRTLAALQQYDAELALLAGKPQGACAAVKTILGLARTLDREPVLISQLVRLKLLNFAVATLARRANAGALDPAEITTLRAAFAQTRATNQSAHALIGERAMYGSYFTISRAELARIQPPEKTPETGGNRLFIPCNGPAILRLAGFYQLDFRYFLEVMDNNIALAGLPPPDNLVTTAAFSRAGASKKTYHAMSALLFSSFAHAVRREVEGVANHRLATTALALEQFRNEEGRLPQNLEELTPDFIAGVPEDPFTGLALEYRRAEKGYLIYSVGPDGKNDGGLEEPETKRSRPGKSHDLVFAVER